MIESGSCIDHVLSQAPCPRAHTHDPMSTMMQGAAACGHIDTCSHYQRMRRRAITCLLGLMISALLIPLTHGTACTPAAVNASLVAPDFMLAFLYRHHTLDAIQRALTFYHHRCAQNAPAPFISMPSCLYFNGSICDAALNDTLGYEAFRVRDALFRYRLVASNVLVSHCLCLPFLSIHHDVHGGRERICLCPMINVSQI